eukprot:XP_001706680.1 Hypothetical protein GL50803_18705 [Giardia lamblia ATCC 50803]
MRSIRSIRSRIFLISLKLPPSVIRSFLNSVITRPCVSVSASEMKEAEALRSFLPTKWMMRMRKTVTKKVWMETISSATCFGKFFPVDWTAVHYKFTCHVGSFAYIDRGACYIHPTFL